MHKRQRNCKNASVGLVTEEGDVKEPAAERFIHGVNHGVGRGGQLKGGYPTPLKCVCH